MQQITFSHELDTCIVNLDNPRVILFNSNMEDSWLSNMYQSFFRLDGIQWPSVEHYLQSKKSKSKRYLERLLMTTPKEALKMGRAVKLDPEYESNKLTYLHNAHVAKFSQNKDLHKRLIETYPNMLVEFTPWVKDTSFYGVDKDGIGINMTGKSIMVVRHNLMVEEQMK